MNNKLVYAIWTVYSDTVISPEDIVISASTNEDIDTYEQLDPFELDDWGAALVQMNLGKIMNKKLVAVLIPVMDSLIECGLSLSPCTIRDAITGQDVEAHDWGIATLEEIWAALLSQ